METPVSESFGDLIEEFRQRVGVSRHRLAVLSSCDPSYIQRMAKGERQPPKLDLVESIARALRLTIADRNRLLVAAGYTPLSVVQLGSWDDALQSVADVLTCIYLTPEERDSFRAVVKSISDRWLMPVEQKIAKGEPVFIPKTNGVEAHHV